MNCVEFDDKLPYLVSGQGPRFLLAAAEEHARECPRCARLLAAAQGTEEAATALSPEELVAAILSATGGPTCARIDEQLAGWADDALESGDRALLEEHLTHCADCREVARELALLREELPQFREIEPDVRFVVDVLEQTSRLEATTRRSARRGAWPSRWRGFWDRPQAAFELAYVGAFLVSLLVTAPHPLTRAGSTRPAAWLSDTADSLAGQASTEAAELRAAARRLRSYVEPPPTHLAALPEPGPLSLWFDRGLRLLQSVELAGRSGQLLWSDVLHGRWEDGRRELSRLRLEIRLCWARADSAEGGGANRPPDERTEPRHLPVRIPPPKN